METEKRQMQKIEWSNLLNTGESVSGFIDDRIPFRYSLISYYRFLSLVPSAVFQSTLPLDVCPKITADAADGALNS